MARYVTKRCPHCGFAYVNRARGDQRKYGCTFQTCTKCKKGYFDKDVKEPALYGYKNLHEVGQGVLKILGVCLLGFVAVGISQSKMTTNILGVLLLVYCLVIIGCQIYDVIYKITHKEEILEYQKKQYDESMARLKDNGYLVVLSRFDSRAKKLLNERMNGQEEHYAKRPE